MAEAYRTSSVAMILVSMKSRNSPFSGLMAPQASAWNPSKLRFGEIKYQIILLSLDVENSRTSRRVDLSFLAIWPACGSKVMFADQFGTE